MYYTIYLCIAIGYSNAIILSYLNEDNKNKDYMLGTPRFNYVNT